MTTRIYIAFAASQEGTKICRSHLGKVLVPTMRSRVNPRLFLAKLRATIPHWIGGAVGHAQVLVNGIRWLCHNPKKIFPSSHSYPHFTHITPSQM